MTTRYKEYWEERLRDKWGSHGVGLPDLGRYYNDWLYKVEGTIFLHHVKFLKNDWTKVDVLDIGSGTGFFVGLWKSIGVNSVTATDITSVAVEKLQKKFTDVNCYRLDIGNGLPSEFSNEQFDVVSALAILYHIVDDDRYRMAFRNIYRLLRPGGYLIFSENFIHAQAARSQYEVSRSFEDINAILDETGFQWDIRVPMTGFMCCPIDSTSNLFKIIWQRMMFPVRRLPLLGYVIGAILCPLELTLTSYLKEGFSTELMICRKK